MLNRHTTAVLFSFTLSPSLGHQHLLQSLDGVSDLVPISVVTTIPLFPTDLARLLPKILDFIDLHASDPISLATKELRGGPSPT